MVKTPPYKGIIKVIRILVEGLLGLIQGNLTMTRMAHNIPQWQGDGCENGEV